MKHINSIFFFLFSLSLYAQVEESVETITQKNLPQSHWKTSALGDTILLPIIDEFTQKSFEPKQKYWVDNKVYINSTHAKNPLSTGVATFDGLDEAGFPYHPTNNKSDTLADVLTSKYLDLSGDVNVFLSFYYQSGGLGEAPGPNDSLVVEFWAPGDTVWEQVWVKKGKQMNQLEPTIIAIDSSKWLGNGFRFRFGAYGALNGAFDVWNIDYVLMAANRNASDSIVQDPAFAEPLPFFIKGFSNVPWFHFKNSILQDSLNTVYRRNGPTPSPPWSLTKNKHVLLMNGNIEQNSPGFVNSTDPHNVDLSNPMIIDNFNPALPTDSFNLELVGVLPGTKVQPFTANDTITGIQTFKNYYAFDDGSAERAYGVKNGFGTRMAIELNPLQPDTLKGVYFRFAHAGEDATNYTFKIAIWENNSGIPGNLIYMSDSSYVPDYGYYHNSFIPYPLDTSIFINGSVFIGIRQNTEEAIYVGLDVNTPKTNNLHYGSSFVWYQSLVNATVMIRPYFKYQPHDISLLENQGLNAPIIFPNPATDILHIKTEKTVTFFITDLMGRNILNGNSEREIDISELESGIYIVTVLNGSEIYSEKIIVK
jgi:hypothetical protein